MGKELRSLAVLMVMGVFIFGVIYSVHAKAPNRATLGATPSISTQSLSISHTTIEPYVSSMVDLDGDGDIDLIGYEGEADVWDDETLFWWENNGNLGFSEHIIATDQEIRYAQPFDMDGDGDMDIVSEAPYYCFTWPCSPPADDEIFLWENDGDEVFTRSSIYAIELRNVSNSPVLVDLDKDGDGDIVTYDAGDELGWIENTDSGWNYHMINWSAYEGGEDILAEDFDKDGFIDIAIANDYTHPTYGWVLDRLDIWKNNGSMGFTQNRIDSNEDRYTGNVDLKAVDFDKDGDKDLVSSNGDVEWWENQGALSFVRRDISLFSAGGVFPGDFDGDGDLDILYRLGYIENLGAGSFQRRAMALALAETTQFGDLNHDGRIDAMNYGFEPNGHFELLTYVTATPQTLPFYTGFEDRYVDHCWENRLALDKGTAYLQSTTVVMGTQSLYFSDPTAEAVLHLNLTGEDQVELSFVLGNKTDPVVEDGLYISDDGIDWHLVMSRTLASTTEWTQFVIDLDEARDLYGLTFNADFQIKFLLNDGGFWLDEVKVIKPGSPNPALKYIYIPLVIK